MAIVTIRVDTDGEAVWFMELARKLGHEVEVDFGNNSRSIDGGSFFHQMEIDVSDPKLSTLEAIAPNWTVSQLARLFKKRPEKNPEK